MWYFNYSTGMRSKLVMHLPSVLGLVGPDRTHAAGCALESAESHSAEKDLEKALKILHLPADGTVRTHTTYHEQATRRMCAFGLLLPSACCARFVLGCCNWVHIRYSRSGRHGLVGPTPTLPLDPAYFSISVLSSGRTSFFTGRSRLRPVSPGYRRPRRTALLPSGAACPVLCLSPNPDPTQI